MSTYTNREYEYSFRVPISFEEYVRERNKMCEKTNIMKKFNMDYKEIMTLENEELLKKLNLFGQWRRCTENNGLIIKLQNKQIIKEKKRLFFIDNDAIEILWRYNVETTIRTTEAYNEIISCLRVVKTICRYWSSLCTAKRDTKIRYALEKHRILKSNSNYYYIHIELEHEHQRSNYDLLELFDTELRLLFSKMQLNRLIFFSRKQEEYIPFTDITKMLTNLNLRRSFVENYKVTVNALQSNISVPGACAYSLKLNGQRANIILSPSGYFIIDATSGIQYYAHNLKLCFYYIGHVERLNDRNYVLIDICHRITVSLENNIESNSLSILASIDFMRNLCRGAKRHLSYYSLQEPYLYCNRYYDRLEDCLEEYRSERNVNCEDGLLAFGKLHINKLKLECTVDLSIKLTDWLELLIEIKTIKKNNYKNIISNKALPTLDILISEESNLPFMKCVLKAYDPKSDSFVNIFDILMLTEKKRIIQDQTKRAEFILNYIQNIEWTPTIDNWLFDKDPLMLLAQACSDYKSIAILNYLVLEFKVETYIDSLNKNRTKLIFLQTREKPTPNTLQYVQNIFATSKKCPCRQIR